MPSTARFNLVGRSRFRNGLSGPRAIVGFMIEGLTMTGLTDWTVQTSKVPATTGFPAIGSPHLDPAYAYMKLLDYEVVGIEREKHVVEGDLIYGIPTAPASGGGAITFVVTDQSQVSHIRAFSSAGGLTSLRTWYKKGTGTGVTGEPSGAKHWSFTYPKMIPAGSIRAVGTATAAQWDAVRDTIRAAKGMINPTNWGGYTRGQVYFVGPSTTTYDSGNSYTISLDFITTHVDWFALGQFLDDRGANPSDSASELNVRSGGLPAVGGQLQRNGITLASIYDEDEDFNTLFGFTP